MQKITFIGLGIMGSRMAANLLKNGVDVTVYNRSKAPVEALLEKGAKTAATANEAVADADIVFSMLSTPEVVEYLFMEEGGVLSAMKKGALWCDCSTVNPSFTERASSASQKQGINFMDTPVAGTLPHAENAELVFFVGGEKEHLLIVEDLLNYMGNKVLHLGGVGKGASFKMLVNVMLAQSMVIFSETLLLGEKLGMDKDFLLKVLPSLKVSAPFTGAKVGMIKADAYDVMFPLELMHKDLHLATLTAYEHNQPLYLANVTKELFAEANRQGMGRLDFAAIHRYLEKK